MIYLASTSGLLTPNLSSSNDFFDCYISIQPLFIYSLILFFLQIDKNSAAAKSLQSCPALCDPVDASLLGSSILGILQARTLNAGVGCRFLLQCMKVKSESEVAQLCLTLRDPMDCSLPGSSVHGSFQERVLEWGAIAFSMIKTHRLYK